MLEPDNMGFSPAPGEFDVGLYPSISFHLEVEYEPSLVLSTLSGPCGASNTGPRKPQQLVACMECPSSISRATDRPDELRKNHVTHDGKPSPCRKVNDPALRTH